MISLFTQSNAYAEIYTYEKDGVIIISSEPPPKPRRKTAKRTKNKRKVAAPFYKNKAHSPQRQRRTRESSKSPNRKTLYSHRRKVTLPRALYKHRRSIQTVTDKYKLPKDLLKQVLYACYTVYSNKKERDRFRTIESYSCLNQTVITALDSQLVRSDQSIASFIEYSAWLIRRLINHYRGDLTLALSTYYFAAQKADHFIYHSPNRRISRLHHLVNRTNRLLNRSYVEETSGQPNKDSREFLRLVLEIKR